MSTCYPGTTYGGNSFVTFVLLRSTAFVREARKIVKKNPKQLQIFKALWNYYLQNHLTPIKNPQIER